VEQIALQIEESP